MQRTSSFQNVVEVVKKREESVDRILSSASSDDKYSPRTSPVSKNGIGIKSRLLGAKNLFRKSKISESDDNSGSTEKTFVSQTNKLLTSITELRDFIQGYKQSYLAKYSSMTGPSAAVLTESEKVKIEDNAEQLVVLCNGLLTNIREIFLPKHSARDSSWSQYYDDQFYLLSSESEQSGSSCLNEKREHEKQVLIMLDLYLREVCNSYAQLKAVRVKDNLERKQYGRLERAAESVLKPHKLTSRNRNDSISSVSRLDTSRNEESSSQIVNQRVDSEDTSKVDDVTLTDEDLQQLQLENQQLLNDLQWMDEQTSTIEGQIVEISKLQNLFTNKVLAQTEQIENIHTTVVSSTENVKQGNEHVRDAIRNNAGLRFWILFFLVVSSFSLLFLDWYDT